MTQGFVQLNPDVDATGKQLDNDIVIIPAGTVVSDGSGNLTTLAAPAYYFRERVVNADPTNPLGLASVKGGVGPNFGEFGLSVNLTPGQSDHNAMLAFLQSMDANLALIAGTSPLTGGFQQQTQFLSAIAGGLGVGLPGAVRPQVGDKFGRNIIIPQTLRELITTFEATITTTTETAISPAIVSDNATVFDLMAILVTNTSATGTYVAIRDQLSTATGPSSLNAVKYISAPANDMRGVSYGGSAVPQSNTGQQWTATANAAVTDLRIWAMYAKNQR